jgi:hypothetical protein
MGKIFSNSMVAQQHEGAMRSDKAKRHAAFVAMIEDVIATANSTVRVWRNGYHWAALPQATWAMELGVTVVTLRQLAKEPPIRGLGAKVHGRRVRLYRVGPEGEDSLLPVARQMEAAFHSKYGRKVDNYGFGCLVGLAELWPAGHQVNIFKTVLSNLQGFMCLVRAFDPDTEWAPRYYEFLPCTLLRKYPHLALEMYEDKLQEAGKFDELSELAPGKLPLSLKTIGLANSL